MSDLQFSGRETFAVPAEVIFEKMIDLDFIAAGMPDVVSSTKESDTSLRCKVRPKTAFFTGTLDVLVEIVENNPPTSVRMKVFSKGIGATIEWVTDMTISPGTNPHSCQVDWSSEVTQLGGLLKSVSKGIIKASAEKMSAETWAGLHKRLEQV